MCPSVRHSVCPPVRPSVRISVRPSITTSVHQSVCLSRKRLTIQQARVSASLALFVRYVTVSNSVAAYFRISTGTTVIHYYILAFHLIILPSLPPLHGRTDGRTDRQTDGRMDGWTDGRIDGWTDGRLEIHPCVLQDIGPLGPLPKKGMDRRTDKAGWRVA